jgi:hypothetical protein
VQQPAAAGQILAGNIRVVAEDRSADDQHGVVSGQSLGERTDGERQHPLELRMILRKGGPLG